jgi:hypothetical protein
VLPQNSDFDAGSIAVFIPTKHNIANINPARNVNPRFLMTSDIQQYTFVPIWLIKTINKIA